MLNQVAVTVILSLFGNWFPGGTGDPPVPSGDPPDGTETTIRSNENGLFTTWLSAVPVGGSPTGAGGSLPHHPFSKHALGALEPERRIYSALFQRQLGSAELLKFSSNFPRA